MRILFIGSVKFSESALKKLIEINSEIIAVITKEKSSFNSDFVDLSELSEENKIPCFYTNDINSIETITQIKKIEPDVIYCFGWSSILKKNILELAPKGVIGFHPSMLPNNRGRHPLIWAKVLGLKSTGSTFFKMDEGADTGDIISQVAFKIGNFDDAEKIYNKMTKVALRQIVEFTKQLKENTETFIKQDLNTGNSWRKRTKEDGKINFRMNNKNICNLIMALSKPYVGAHVVFNNSEYKVWDAKKIFNSDYNNFEPGKILSSKEGRIIVKTGDGAIEFTNLELSKIIKKNDYITE